MSINGNFSGTVGAANMSRHTIELTGDYHLVTTESQLASAIAVANARVEIQGDITLTADRAMAAGVRLFSQNSSPLNCVSSFDLRPADNAEIIGVTVNGDGAIKTSTSGDADNWKIVYCNVKDVTNVAVDVRSTGGASVNNNIEITDNIITGCSQILNTNRADGLTFARNWCVGNTAGCRINGGDYHKFYNNRLDDVGGGIIFQGATSAGQFRRSNRWMEVYQNDILLTSGEGVGLDGRWSESSNNAAIDELTVGTPATGGTYNSSPTIRVGRTAALPSWVADYSYAVFSSGTNAGKAFKLAGSSVVDASNIDLTFDDDVFTSAEFSAISTNDDISIALVNYAPKVYANYLAFAEGGSGTLLSAWGATHYGEFYSNFVVVNTLPTSANYAAGMRFVCMADLNTSSAVASRNSSLAVLPVGQNLIRNNTVYGNIRTAGRCIGKASHALTDGANFGNVVLNNNAVCETQQWLDNNVGDNEWEGSAVDSTASWTNNTAEQGGQTYPPSAHADTGTRWWSGAPNPIGVDGEPLNDWEPPVGCIQDSTYAFLPRNL